MREGAPTSHDRPEAGNPKLYPYLLEPSGGTYYLRGRARFPEGAKPPAQFVGGRLTWQALDGGDVWTFEACAEGNAPGDSTVGARNAIGQIGESEILLLHRAIMDALWAAGCRAARVDSYQWQADAEGAYLMTGDLVAPDCTDDCEVIDDDTPKRAIVRGDLADAEACLRAVFGDALELGPWERSPGGNLVAELALGQAPRAEEVAR